MFINKYILSTCIVLPGPIAGAADPSANQSKCPTYILGEKTGMCKAPRAVKCHIETQSREEILVRQLRGCYFKWDSSENINTK